MHVKSRLSGCILGGISFGIAATGDAYNWPSYRSDLDYDTRSNIGVINPPTKFSTDCDGVTGQKAGKWWAFYWGNDRDPRVTDEAIDSLLAKYDRDFGFLRDTMGWAPDRRAQNGYYSAVYYYGSGTCAGGAKTDTTGGWQTNVGSNYYEAVAASFYPVYSFNPSCPYHDKVAQQDAMVHEGIHSMTKAYPGAQNAHWFQEGGNTWIQQEMAAQRDKSGNWHSGMGFLNAGAVIAPFVPIESYSGWLLDGSFGGPDAAGVGVYNGSTQLCNWRNLLGGYQYGNVFPTFLGEWVGKGAVRWIYGNAYGKTNYLLETFALDKGLGDQNTRRLIMEYRARLALLDMKLWSENMRTLLNDNFGGVAKAEWSPSNGTGDPGTVTPYQTMTKNGEWLVPESSTTPGWSGANIVPLTVQNGANTVSVTLKALGENMSVQLCYRATDGTPVYSEPVQIKNSGSESTTTLKLSKTPQSNVVFAVICNTDYQYTGNENIRTNHYNYNLKLVSGLSGAADAHTKWYNDFQLKYDWPEIGNNYSPDVSSSSVKQSSSSSAKSSSSVKSSSSQKVSSSSMTSSSSSALIEGSVVKTYEISTELPIDDNYAAVNVQFDAAEIAQKLGIDNISKATFIAKESNGNITAKYTALAPGHWFDNQGNVTDWGENAYVFGEAKIESAEIAIGHYPNHVKNGEIYRFTQGFNYNGKTVLLNMTVKITNEKANPDAGNTTALTYGLKGLASHLSLNNQAGLLEVDYTLDRNDFVKISLFNGYGALVSNQFIGKKSAGSHTFTFDLRQMPSTTYIVKITSGAYREAKSITIAK